jgi:hypothetical protein
MVGAGEDHTPCRRIGILPRQDRCLLRSSQWFTDGGAVPLEVIECVCDGRDESVSVRGVVRRA